MNNFDFNHIKFVQNFKLIKTSGINLTILYSNKITIPLHKRIFEITRI